MPLAKLVSILMRIEVSSTGNDHSKNIIITECFIELIY